jgi:hypothetical protein
MLVLITDEVSERHNEVFSHCTASLIVICNQESANRIVTPDSEFACKIPDIGNSNP